MVVPSSSLYRHFSEIIPQSNSPHNSLCQREMLAMVVGVSGRSKQGGSTDRKNSKVVSNSIDTAFRHPFNTALSELEVSPDIQAQLAGHSRGETIAAVSYRKDTNAERLLDYVKQLDFKLPAIKLYLSLPVDSLPSRTD
nr:hypothetical protein [Pseudomonas prosekii]